MERLNGNLPGTPREVYLPAASPYCRILSRTVPHFGRALPFAGSQSVSRGRPCLVLAGAVAGGPLGFLPEGAGEGFGVGGHGPGAGRCRRGRCRGRGRGRPGHARRRGRSRAARPRLGRLGRPLRSAKHPLVLFLGRVSVEHPAGSGPIGVAAEFLRFGDERGRDLGQAAARLQDQQVAAPV